MAKHCPDGDHPVGPVALPAAQPDPRLEELMACRATGEKSRSPRPAEPARWEDAAGGMQRIRVAGGHIYRFIWTRDGSDGLEQTIALGLTFVPEPRT